MNDEQRAALVEELANTGKMTIASRTFYREIPMNDEYAAVVAQVHDGMYRLDDADILAHPIVQRLISDRTTAAEPDAETVERVARAMYTANLVSPEEPAWDEEDGWVDDYMSLHNKARWRDLARAAIAAMPSSCAKAKEAQQ